MSSLFGDELESGGSSFSVFGDKGRVLLLFSAGVMCDISVNTQIMTMNTQHICMFDVSS